MSQILKCSVKWCETTSKNCTENGEDITFHTFPKCPEIKDKWIDACQNEDALWRPSKDSVVCSRHFTDDCYRQLKGPRRLRIRSVPTLNLPKKIIWEGSLRDMVITDYLKEQREKKQLLQLLEKKIVTEKRSDRRKSYDRKKNRKVKQSTRTPRGENKLETSINSKLFLGFQ